VVTFGCSLHSLHFILKKKIPNCLTRVDYYKDEVRLRVPSLFDNLFYEDNQNVMNGIRTGLMLLLPCAPPPASTKHVTWLLGRDGDVRVSVIGEEDEFRSSKLLQSLLNNR
jgi:hypothetical protein